jgi:tetratricopeptide (TPR) repeat protein|tara:strand:- start:9399 stop:10106 length:708 start_codon:yes stop_codon:yes gene_type:complete
MKIYSLFKILILSIFTNSFSYGSIEKADSLFYQKNYLESKKIYDSIFYVENQFSNSMLLKMSAIEESIGNYEKAIFYLEIFQKKDDKLKVKKKIKDIVLSKNLSGYDEDNKKTFIRFYEKYNGYLLIFLLIISCFIFIVNSIKFFKKRKAIFLIPFFYTSCALILIIINFKPLKEGIVFKENTFIMKEPSSGSDLYKILNKGDKISVSKDLEIWYEVIIMSEKRYVRKKNIRLIN